MTSRRIELDTMVVGTAEIHGLSAATGTWSSIVSSSWLFLVTPCKRQASRHTPILITAMLPPRDSWDAEIRIVSESHHIQWVRTDLSRFLSHLNIFLLPSHLALSNLNDHFGCIDIACIVHTLHLITSWHASLFLYPCSHLPSISQPCCSAQWLQRVQVPGVD